MAELAVLWNEGVLRHGCNCGSSTGMVVEEGRLAVLETRKNEPEYRVTARKIEPGYGTELLLGLV